MTDNHGHIVKETTNLVRMRFKFSSSKEGKYQQNQDVMNRQTTFLLREEQRNANDSL